MNEELIYVKTPSGEDAVRDRTRLVQRNLRMVLIMVDGLTNVAALKHKAGDAALIENSLAELERIGLIEPFGARAGRSVDAAATKSIMTDPATAEYLPEEALESAETIFEPVEPRLPATGETIPPELQVSPVPVQMPAMPVTAARSSLAGTLAGTWQGVKQRWAQAREERAYERAYGTPTSAPDGYPVPTISIPRRTRKLGLRKRVIAAITLALVLMLLGVALYPYDEYRPELETQLTAIMGDEVRIDGNIYLKLTPAPALLVEQLSVGSSAKRHIEADRLRLFLAPQFLFGGSRFRKAEVDGLRLGPGASGTAVRWFQAGPMASEKLERFAVNGLSIDLGWTRLLVDRGVLMTAGEGGWVFSSDSADGRLHMLARPDTAGIRVSGRAEQWVTPVDPSLVVTSLDFEAHLSKDQLTLSKIDARAYDGMLTGRGSLSWQFKPAVLSLDITMQRIAAAKLLEALQGSRPSLIFGDLSGRLQLNASPPSYNWLGAETRIDGTVSVMRGELKGLDFAEALKEGGDRRGAIRGGSTAFEELTGKVALDGEQIRVTGARISSGRMTAGGQVGVARNTGVLSGVASIEMRGSARAAKTVATISGTPAMPELRSSR